MGARDEEVWKKIEDFPRFAVSNYGRIKILSYRGYLGERMSKAKYIDKLGRKKITLRNDSGVCVKQIHRLVGHSFVQNPKNKPHINHKDGNRLNNFYRNLEWCTHKENMRHAAENGLIAYGDGHWATKLNTYQIKIIDFLLRNTKMRGCQIARYFDVSEGVISRLKHNKCRRKIKWAPE